MQLNILNSINNLNENKIKGCKYEGIEDEGGAIYQKSESGEEFNILRWIEHVYTITLQLLTYKECENIVKDFIEAKKNRAIVTISKRVLVKKGYIDMKKIPGEPKFYYELKDIKPKQSTGKPYYEMTLKVKERVDFV
ncbi:hypothetical protein [Fusobacterium ulcerans]|uniref:hypothetical protein n=1 Tax=Fusobacterium ulcerans TaxID=861 RepID=UPI000E473A24|nr:hypothetical protein [Fusobacterium ulcerans]MEE0136856.1 hypothetical protein [Fusobacterium ulcerans]RGY61947.1 hypothetical protein DXA30_13375 [Fusobacterium ulcerans]